MSDSNRPWYMQGHPATELTRREIQTRARTLLESVAYENALLSRISAGTLPPAVEVMLWHYAYGKPVEQIELTTKTEDLSSLSTTQMQDRIAALHARLREIEDVTKSLPADYRQIA